MAQRVGRGIALLFHDRGTRRGRVVSSTPRPHFTSGKEPVHILQEAGWAPGPVWTGGKSRPHRYSIPDPPARSSVAIPTELPGTRNLHILVLFTYRLAHFMLRSCNFAAITGWVCIQSNVINSLNLKINPSRPLLVFFGCFIVTRTNITIV